MSEIEVNIPENLYNDAWDAAYAEYKKARGKAMGQPMHHMLPYEWFVANEVYKRCRGKIAELEAENKRLREALERLGSTEAFSMSFFIKNNNEGNELRDRIDFARSFSKGGQ